MTPAPTESYSLGNYHPVFSFKFSWGCSLLTKLATAYCITLISSLTTLQCFIPWYILSGGDTIIYLRYIIISFNVAGNNDGINQIDRCYGQALSIRSLVVKYHYFS